MLITSIAQFRKCRKAHEVDIGDDVSLRILEPFVADMDRMQSLADDDLVGLCGVLASLLLAKDDKPLFASGDEMHANLPVGVLRKIGDWIGDFGDAADEQAKNSSTRAAKRRKKAKKSSRRGSR